MEPESFMPAEADRRRSAAHALINNDLQCAPGIRNATILLVDANSARRRLTLSAVAPLGCRVLEAGNTGQALGSIDNAGVDLVMADMGAPDVGAPGFCRLLREPGRASQPAVLVMTQGTQADEDVIALEAGADVVLHHSVHPRALRASIQGCLRRNGNSTAHDDTESILFALAQSVEERDPALGQHCERLAFMAAGIGTALGLNPENILALQRGGYLHDIGKVAIPDSVLFKPGPLTPEEWEIMKSHTERGERICRNVRPLAPVLPIIRSHHERWDGGGYPDGLKGEEIPLLARIVQITDIYDALTTARPYKRAYRPSEALELLQQESAKGWRDPNLVKLFCDLLPLFQPSANTDWAHVSLQSLASSLERFRKEPARAASGCDFAPVKMVSGL